jgi:hypothetical protein
MSNQAFRRPISVDSAPQGHRCDWCNKLAVQQLTAIGGVHHNQAGFFCEECGEEFAHAVKAKNKILTAGTQTSSPDVATPTHPSGFSRTRH